MIYYLIYTSNPTNPITYEMMEEITSVSRKKNKRSQVTGMLLGIEGKFLQYLEGDEEEVNATFDRIKQDPRHQKVMKWITGFGAERIFSNWSMGSWVLSNSELEDLNALEDLKKFLQDPVNESLQSKKFISMMNELLNTWIAHEPERLKKINDEMSR